MNMRSFQPACQRGFSLTELLLVLGVMLLIGTGVWWLYDRTSDAAHARADITAMTGMWANLQPLLMRSTTQSLNSSASSSTADLMSDPVGFSTLVGSGMQCSGQYGYVECVDQEGGYSYIDTMSVQGWTCDPDGSNCQQNGPIDVFALRYSIYSPSNGYCMALTEGFASSTLAGSSELFILSGDYSTSQDITLGDPDALSKLAAGCNDSTGAPSLVMVEFYPFGLPFGGSTYAPL